MNRKPVRAMLLMVAGAIGYVAGHFTTRSSTSTIVEIEKPVEVIVEKPVEVPVEIVKEVERPCPVCQERERRLGELEEKLKGVVQIDAKSLAAAFKANAFAADQKYTGKQLRLSGAVDRIEVELDGLPSVWFAVPSGFGLPSVRCRLGSSKQRKEVALLRRGDDVVIVGQIRVTPLSIIDVADCELIGH